MTRMACETPATGAAARLAAGLGDRIPVLETRRLLLRAPRLGDFDTYADIACGPRGAHMGGPMTRAAAWYDFAALTAGWMLRGHGVWTIVSRNGGDPLGFVLLGFEPGDAEPELGFLLTEAAEGHGYAAEAAEAARHFGFIELGLPSLVSYIAPGNARSVALAERLGATPAGTLRYETDPEPSLVYRHPRPEDA